MSGLDRTEGGRHERSTRGSQARGRLDRRSAAVSIPSELPILPLRDTVLFPEFVHAARRGARELGPPDRRRDRQRQADRGLHAARRGGRGAGPGRSVRGRHRHAHSQDVQAARRQPAPDRPGPRAADARRGRRRRIRTCARASAPRPKTPTMPIGSRSTRWRATSRRTSSRSSRCRRCSPTICRRSP